MKRCFTLGIKEGVSVSIALPHATTTTRRKDRTEVRQLVLQSAAVSSLSLLPTKYAAPLVCESLRVLKCGGGNDTNEHHIVDQNEKKKQVLRRVLRASVAHEEDGSMAAIARVSSSSTTSTSSSSSLSSSSSSSSLSSSKINMCGVDVVLPARIQRARRRWGAEKKFTSRWLGEQNLAVLRHLMISQKNRNVHQDLACAVAWGWRESIIKALSSFDVLSPDHHNKSNNNSNRASSMNFQKNPAGAFHLTQIKLEDVVLFGKHQEHERDCCGFGISCSAMRVLGNDAARELQPLLEMDNDANKVVGCRFQHLLELGAVVLPRGRRGGEVVVCWACA